MREPKIIEQKLNQRIFNNALRRLDHVSTRIDFSSNDYLGLTKSKTVLTKTQELLSLYNSFQNGSGGSRLITGHSQLFEDTEQLISNFHHAQNALIFNSGYNANHGIISAVCTKNDTILYDELIHASLREAIQYSPARSIKFKHNDINDALLKMDRCNNKGEIYLVTESVFSMDGDAPDLLTFVNKMNNHVHFIVDEAHALGVCGKHGEGLCQKLNIEDKIFARIITFGKGLGCHGAAILGSDQLKKYLINFCRPFIYTTAMAPHSIATIHAGYDVLKNSHDLISRLKQNIEYFRAQFSNHSKILQSYSAIQSIICPGNTEAKTLSQYLLDNEIDARAILSPTVPKGKERLRICLHAYNTKEEIEHLKSLIDRYNLA